MVYTPEKILSLLPLLDEQIANDLENETLDFKECQTEAKLREFAKEMAKYLGMIWAIKRVMARLPYGI